MITHNHLALGGAQFPECPACALVTRLAALITELKGHAHGLHTYKNASEKLRVLHSLGKDIEKCINMLYSPVGGGINMLYSPVGGES